MLLITMGCGDECPYVPGLERADWPLRDPKGLPISEVRPSATRFVTGSRISSPYVAGAERADGVS